MQLEHAVKYNILSENKFCDWKIQNYQNKESMSESLKQIECEATYKPIGRN